MSIDWIVIETVAILVESFAVVFFLDSRYKSKYSTNTPQLFAWLLLVSWGVFYVFADVQINDFFATGITYSIGLAYLCLAKYGRFLYKIFGVVLISALSLCISLVGAGIVTGIVGKSIEHTLIEQDDCRLLTIMLIKSMQVTLFYAISKKRRPLRSLKRKSVFILTGAVALVFSCLLLMFINISYFNAPAIGVMTWISTSLLVVLVGIFYLYEAFAQEEICNILLSENIQRLELETRYFRELDAVYSDLRTWRHEYKNTLLALRSVAKNETVDKVLEYLDDIGIDSCDESIMLQTGNHILDSVVSSKLRIAQKNNINIDIQAVYPENNNIETKDLCAIIGNLLDNAIEACERMDGTARFISFSILTKGKNLAISVVNSYDGDIMFDGRRYLTLKDTGSHGIGISYIDSIVDKLRGYVLRKHSDGIFETYVLLPLVKIEGEHKKNAISNKENHK